MDPTAITIPRRLTRTQGLVIGLCVVVVALASFFVGQAWAADEQKRNDVVFSDRNSQRGPDYVEVFKKEGTSGKNYLYTLSWFIDPGSGEYCTSVTFASETAGWGKCLPRDQVDHPERYRPLDPNMFPDRKPS